MAVSFQCMTKFTTNKKKKIEPKKKKLYWGKTFISQYLNGSSATYHFKNLKVLNI